MEITTIWFLAVMVGGMAFGSLKYYDSKEECEADLQAIVHVQSVEKTQCMPQPISPKAKP